jgi:outer membrane protein assembly factor BamB
MSLRAAAVVLATAVAGLSAGAADRRPVSHWPQFRGPFASGRADGSRLPDTWSAPAKENIAWTSRIPGLAHSSPIVHLDRVFVTTAISSRTDATFKPGLYGAGTASEDVTVHKWNVLALDLATGKVLWERTAYEGVPKEKRHIKATYANATPATDGRYVVAFFGSQGLYAYDLDGNLQWKRDLGRLNAGAYDLPEYEWGTASSPIIWNGLVIVQADQQKDSFLAALRLSDGSTAWKTTRDELPSWATPGVYPDPKQPELITNSPRFIRGYDPKTGAERWRLGRSSNITAPTPVFDDGLIVVGSGRRPNAPLFVLKPGARGDITLPEDATSGGNVVWTRTGAGPYMPTPLVHGGLVYVLKNQGILTCWDLRTGEKKYEERLPGVTAGFSASPVAADGRLYLASEDGDVHVVRLGPKFEVIATNPMGQPLMATPAIAGGMLIVRGERDLFAVRAARARRP